MTNDLTIKDLIDELKEYPEDTFKNMAKGFQDMGKAIGKFNKSLAKIFLSMPIPMKYETWVFLHSIANGDE